MDDGIKSFPFPIKTDDRIALVEAEFGLKGYAVVWKLHQAIYSRGYYLKWDIDAQLLFIRDYHLSEVGRNAVSEIVACCIRRGVFESSLYEKYGILTSERIQETFLTAKARSVKVIMENDYALPIVYSFIETANEKGKNVNIFWKNADIFEQRKGKEKKEEPPLPPNGGAQGDREEFLKLYPALKPNGDDSLIDYSKLKAAFSRSQYLRRTYSFKWLIEHYDAIIQGFYEDKEDEKCDADKNTEKERFYAARRNTAIAGAEKAKRLAEQDEAYKSADRLVKQTEIQILKAERTAPHNLPELQQILEEAKANRATALKRLNLTEDDFIPKYACAKCWDTGYMADGTPCDCYGGTE